MKFAAEDLDFDLADEAVVGSWSAPGGMDSTSARAALQEALERPRGYPSLRQCVTPGDRVAVVLGEGLPEPSSILAALTETLVESGVAAESIMAFAPTGSELEPSGATIIAHDPRDREQFAYLASTTAARRVYLNRILTDADFVLPVGLLGYDPRGGRRGPWDGLFPGLSDAATLEALRGEPLENPPSWSGPSGPRSEALEVAEMLGCRFQVGVVPGVGGPAEFVAGLAEEVRDQGAAAVDRLWRFRVASPADFVVAGIGGPDAPTSLEQLVTGLATASRLVQRGGRIVALSRAAGPLGPALRRLIAAGETANWTKALRGLESAPDAATARLLARVLAQADVHLLSSLDGEMVEDLSMLPLGRPEEARKLVARALTATFLERAELAWGEVAPDDPDGAAG